MHQMYTVTVFINFVADDHSQSDNSNIKLVIKSYTSHHQRKVSCMCAYSENHEGNSMLQTLHSETNFLETNFLNKLILHSFQFIICTNIRYRVLDNRAEKKLFFL